MSMVKLEVEDPTFPKQQAYIFIFIFFVIPLYLQSVPVHSENLVWTYTVASGRVLSGTAL
jgi:hypothetical protein